MKYHKHRDKLKTVVILIAMRKTNAGIIFFDICKYFDIESIYMVGRV